MTNQKLQTAAKCYCRNQRTSSYQRCPKRTASFRVTVTGLGESTISHMFIPECKVGSAKLTLSLHRR
jgi:hypothetical protein